MSFMKNRRTIPSYLKYFSSYMIIVTVLILGAYFIIRSQLMEAYYAQSVDRSKIQLANVAEQLNNSLILLSRVDSAINANNELREICYLEDITPKEKYRVVKELNKYKTTSNLLEDIIYMPGNADQPIVSSSRITLEEGIFYIKGERNQSITFDPSPYMDALRGQLIFLSGDNQQYLIYFPAISSKANCYFFYLLDIKEIQLQLKDCISEEMSAVALIDGKGQIVTGENTSLLLPYTDTVSLESGIYRLDSGDSLCVQAEIGSDMRLISLLSHEFLSNQINEIFIHTYLAIVLLGVIGFLLILWSMRMTYMPLRRLIRKIAPNSEYGVNYLVRLEDIFQKVENENQQMKEKLNDYRVTMQKALLDSFMVSVQNSERCVPSDVSDVNLDHLFVGNPNKEIFVVYVSSPKGVVCQVTDCCLKYLKQRIHGSSSCIVLESETGRAVFLIAYIDPEPDKKERLKELLYQFYTETGCLSVISSGSDSPLDIPSLYEDVMRASIRWSQDVVVDSELLSPVSNVYAYPHDKLKGLSETLMANDFQKTREIMDEIFDIVGSYHKTVGKQQSFLIPCILIDLLINIVNYMNQSHIKFNTYSELYYETLYYCRSCPYNEKAEEIAVNISKLLDICEQEHVERMVKSISYIQVMEESYCQPDFSVVALADRFHVSAPHMSKVFREGQGMSFTDYLWMLRLQKAKELLRDTDMPVDEVAVAVGYSNTSSFRRKFKAETGITPSQFRANDNTE